MKITRSLAALALSFLAACGGSGGGDATVAGTATPTRTGTQPTATVTATATPTVMIVGSTLFVRATAGSDDNDGMSPAEALQTIRAALTALPGLSSGRTIVVGPGTYTERIEEIANGSEERPVVLVADSTGDRTQDDPGAVVLRDTGDGPHSMLRLINRQFIEIDGFVIRGARGSNMAGIDIRNSTDITIRNCEVSDGTERADGIAVIRSSRVSVINNLVFANGRRGIRVAGSGTGSRAVRLVNNTVANNGGQGVVIGTSSVGSEASLLFNVIQDNEGSPDILVTGPSVELFSADTNLVFPGRYDPSDLPQEFDINEDALFVDATAGLYLLSPGSPAIDGGFQDTFPEDLLGELIFIKSRTTSQTGARDAGELDLGFHAVAKREVPPPPPSGVFYVRESGDDERAGGTSPDDALRSIDRALGAASGGNTIIVGPGVYGGQLQIQTTARQGAPLIIFADPTGVMTGDAPGVVAVEAGGLSVGFQFTGASNVVLDGFGIFGARDAAVEVRSNSSNIVVRNCFIDGFGQLLDGSGNGITVDDSTGIELVNNLISFNDGSGIEVRRSDGTNIINNTIAENGVRGIRVGSGSIGAENTFVQNNVVTFSGDISIDLNIESAITATLSHNLVFPHEYRPLSTSQLDRSTDIDADAGFVSFDNFRLDSGSPARNAADPETDSGIRDDLATRTTDEDQDLDDDTLDLGYHYPILPPPPTSSPGRGG